MTTGSGGPPAVARPGSGRRTWFSGTSVVRLAVMTVVGSVAAVVEGLVGQWPFAPLCGWDVAVLVFLAWIWLTIGRMGSKDTASHATRENPGRAASEVILIGASVASLVAVGYVLVRANSAAGADQSALAGLGVASVALSWFVVHTLFTLRYALLYYTGPDRGIDFKQQVPPRYADFAYVAFTVGMTFQIADTDLRSPVMRSMVLRQALLSYLFGAVILASMINLIAGLGGGGG